MSSGPRLQRKPLPVGTAQEPLEDEAVAPARERPYVARTEAFPNEARPSLADRTFDALTRRALEAARLSGDPTVVALANAYERLKGAAEPLQFPQEVLERLEALRATIRAQWPTWVPIPSRLTAVVAVPPVPIFIGTSPVAPWIVLALLVLLLILVLLKGRIPGMDSFPDDLAKGRPAPPNAKPASEDEREPDPNQEPKPGRPRTGGPDVTTNRRPHVDFVPNVRAPNTPAGMNDRISKRSPVAVKAVVSNATGLPIQIETTKTGKLPGSATIDGAKSTWITGTKVLQVQGVQQTQPTGGNLQLAAWYEGDLIGQSNTFTVSTIIENWSVQFEDAPTFKDGFELWVQMHWQHDGTGPRDPNEVKWLEGVEVREERGAFVGAGIGEVQTGSSDGDLMPAPDRHGVETSRVHAQGYQRIDQLFFIEDRRSSSRRVPSTNSGFRIERICEPDPGDRRAYRLRIIKTGAPVIVRGEGANAGTGRAEATWALKGDSQ